MQPSDKCNGERITWSNQHLTEQVDPKAFSMSASCVHLGFATVIALEPRTTVCLTARCCLTPPHPCRAVGPDRLYRAGVPRSAGWLQTSGGHVTPAALPRVPGINISGKAAADRQTDSDRQTDRRIHINRHMDGQTDIQTDRHAYKDK